ncbi:hypothetical protein GSbR_37440 [Geobacter sp. SVR]|nr:hypothetical protein GSVR_28520 [Geobacter sp. SVR]GCF87144.1 hypothetical protein GSbR_37440 [Geobacter sp. SVR]
MEALLQIVAYLLPIIVEGIRSWNEKNKGENHDANIQQFRTALAKNDAAAVSQHLADQHDRVQYALRGH